MTIKWVGKSGTNRRVVVFFAGWGMDVRPFSHYRFNGYDFAVIYDYSGDFPSDDIAAKLSDYDEICLFAWSFGVANAQRFMSDNPQLHITLRVAVNGTPHPVDDLVGIPETIYNGTLAGFSEPTLYKFRRRMCGTRQATDEFLKSAPERSLQSLLDELRTMADIDASGSSVWWDHVYISENDMIFPAQSQQRAWEGHGNIRMLPGEYHMIDFESLINEILLDKNIVAQRFATASRTYDENAIVQREMVESLVAMLGGGRFENILEVGAGTGLLSRALESQVPHKQLTKWDLSAQQPDVVECDAESKIRNCQTGQYDLIISASAIQWFHSPATFVMECDRVLSPKGVLAIATYAPGTFCELSQAGIKGIDYLDEPTWRDVLERGNWSSFSINKQQRTLAFSSPLEVFRHIKHTGVNAIGSSGRNIAALQKLLRDYPLKDGSNPLTYCPIFLLARH